MKRFLNVALICLVTAFFIVPVFAVFNTMGIAGDVKLRDKYPPSWYQILPAEKRFVLVMNGEAVLDKETGLVWERSPSQDIWGLDDAKQRAYEKVIANRKGWRLPTIEELSSLVDITQKNPALPMGHPFKNIQSDIYHSSTISGRIGTTTYRDWSIDFSDGQTMGGGRYIWCVRGGYGYNN